MPATPALPLELWLGKGRRGNPGPPSLKQEFSLKKRKGDSLLVPWIWACCCFTCRCSVDSLSQLLIDLNNSQLFIAHRLCALNYAIACKHPECWHYRNLRP